jgi:hypothetical protein
MFLLVRRFLAAFAFFQSIYLSYHSDMMVVLPSNEHKARGLILLDLPILVVLE